MILRVTKSFSARGFGSFDGTKEHENQFNLKVPNIYENCENEKSEFPVKVKWIKSLDRRAAKWKSKSGLFSTQLIKASLQGQQTTVKFLENAFDVNFSELMMEE
ncbi:MAG: hypothetical protein PF590_03920 [Candidatus Delongbacteria bacterium]|jgi:hypothetical protein|nr:hypothetical protein [Candidatus Delongbacteria bacterium]